MSKIYNGFECQRLDENHELHVGQLPSDLILEAEGFGELWQIHPLEYHKIMMPGGEVETPRWQQAFGADYYYTGRVNKALPVPPLLVPLREWCQTTIDARLNGILVNWYEGQLDHYIGAHRDSTENMEQGAPIVTISFGETRNFRLRPWKGSGFTDFPTSNGSAFIMPYDTNLAFTHEVPSSKKRTGRRISVTVRAFTQS